MKAANKVTTTTAMAVGKKKGIIGVVLLIVVLVPMTFAQVGYYESGLDERKTMGAVDTDRTNHSKALVNSEKTVEVEDKKLTAERKHASALERLSVAINQRVDAFMGLYPASETGEL
jgi:hypothetical protein